MDPNVIINRILRLARLDTSVFDEVRDDPNETIPAVIVAVVSALLAGLGAFLWWSVVPESAYRDNIDGKFLNTIVLGTIFMAVMYGVAALVAYVVLVQGYKAQLDLTSLIRTMGYAALPLALSLLMFIPFLWPVFSLLPLALLLVMTIYAIQAASGADSTHVVIAAVAGLAVMILVLGFIATQTDAAEVPMGAGQFGILTDYKS